jgi:hypothetical protein
VSPLFDPPAMTAGYMNTPRHRRGEFKAASWPPHSKITGAFAETPVLFFHFFDKSK